ncbi:MAG: hypothetical protein WAU10_07435, partial [Caldilineaceae bacterium]
FTQIDADPEKKSAFLCVNQRPASFTINLITTDWVRYAYFYHRDFYHREKAQGKNNDSLDLYRR